MLRFHFLGFLFFSIIFIIFIKYYVSRKDIKTISNRKTHLITISKMKWSKNKLNINRGDKIIWKNLDGPRIQITNDSYNIKNSEILNYYDEYSHIFNDYGKYTFRIPLYLKMKNFVVKVK